MMMTTVVVTATSFVMSGSASRLSPACSSKDSNIETELEKLRKENEELKELMGLQKENEKMRTGLSLPKSKFFDRFFGGPLLKKDEKKEEPKALSLLDEMDEMIHSSTSLLGGLMNSMLSMEGFESMLTSSTQDDVQKVMDQVKKTLEEKGELSKNVVCDPPASQAYQKTTIDGKETTTVTLLLRAHAAEDTNLSGIVRVNADIDEKGNVNIAKLELNKNLLLAGDKQESLNVEGTPAKEKQAA